METRETRPLRFLIAPAVCLALAPAAGAATLYAANNGVDSAACGAAGTPCRSITKAMANAAAGDTIQVRPGIYSANVNHDATLGGPGEEVPSFGGALTILKSLIVLSTDGAAATLIEGGYVPTNSNVLILAANVEFGRPDHGFTVTATQHATPVGIAAQATNVKVRGNLAVNDLQTGVGIQTQAFAAAVLIEKNQVLGWEQGIEVSGEGNIANANQVSRSGVGIRAHTGSITGNVVVGCGDAIGVGADTSAIGNATYGNGVGFIVEGPFLGAIQKNNIFGNTCGLENLGNTGLVATNNYWGAVTGPGPDPADTVCNMFGGTTITMPFVTARFAINPSFDP